MKFAMLLFAVFVVTVVRILALQNSIATKSETSNTPIGARAFEEAYKVFMHPRCVNCHPAGDSPLGGDGSQPHVGLRLHRGADGRGVLTLKCTNCHQAQNQDVAHAPPGAPNVRSDGSLDYTTPRWHLPPSRMPMIFQGRSAEQLCQQLLDPKQNGGMTREQLFHHVSTDPLVLWGWKPGEGRTTPPITHSEFIASVKAWLDSGGVCPK